MKLQDLFPFDSSEPHGTFYANVGNYSYIIFSNSVKAIHHQLWRNKTYLLKWSDGNVQEVSLLNAIQDKNNTISLILLDVKSRKKFKLTIPEPQEDCTWVLIDLDYLQEQVEHLIKLAYCENN